MLLLLMHQLNIAASVASSKFYFVCITFKLCNIIHHPAAGQQMNA